VLIAGKTDLTNALAGGNFKFSGDNTNYGHNPLELGVSSIVSPPGWKSSGFDANGQVGTVATWTSQLTCDGTWGCHGLHDATGVLGSHHYNSTGQLNTATTVGNSFRMLYKIKGYEDSDLQYTSSATDHNVYYGEVRSSDSTADTQTMSYFCAECHGIFHSGSGSEGISNVSFTSPWIRHPVDISMPTTGEYVPYNAYRTDAPLASSSVPASSSSNAYSPNRIVMCLTCHQAHATPNYAILRWNYRGTSGTWINGCAYCHTYKN
jgi:cytochrome c553